MQCKVCASGKMNQPDGKMYRVCDVCMAAEIVYVPQAASESVSSRPTHIQSDFWCIRFGKNDHGGAGVDTPRTECSQRPIGNAGSNDANAKGNLLPRTE